MSTVPYWVVKLCSVPMELKINLLSRRQTITDSAPELDDSETCLRLIRAFLVDKPHVGRGHLSVDLGRTAGRVGAPSMRRRSSACRTASNHPSATRTFPRPQTMCSRPTRASLQLGGLGVRWVSVLLGASAGP